MKKSILALAVLGAFAGTAVAQTNVTLYGIADAGIGSANNGDGNAVTVFSGIQSTSRFGVRGSEDLGSGLKATFNIEAGVNWDTGAADSTFWQRRSVVGIAGGFGEFRLGRDYTPGFTAAGTTDVMGYGLFGNWLTFTTSGASAGIVNGGITTRASNGLHYTSPNWGGFTLRAMYASGESNGSVVGKRAGDMYGLSGVYDNGPLTVSAYYQQTKQATVALDTANDDQFGVGAQYKFGVFRIAANYGEAKLKSQGDIKHQGVGIGGGMKIGTGEILLNVIQQKLKDTGLGEDPKGTTWGLAYVYPMSKRTNLYASLGTTRNNDNGSFNLAYSQSSIAAANPGDDPKAFAVGIRHLF